MSFHVPRKHLRQESGMSQASTTPPRIPPKSRARASTAPQTQRIVARIASAMIEKERLQAEIDSMVERQSIYLSSRPSTGYDMRGAFNHATAAGRELTSADLEPMPSIPALPAAAPSFAERVSVDDRPRTAPSHMTVQEKTLSLTAAAQSHSSQPTTTTTPYPAIPPYHRGRSSSPRDDGRDAHLERPLAPPLPLVLRPPLRKKKSFSRVSNWLFNPEDDHNSSAGSSPTMIFTTSPRPVKESDGFYQCLAPPEGLPRTSMETSSSVYTWETNETKHGDGDDGSSEEDETKTVPTTMAAWSPDQTPKQGAASSRHTTPVLGSVVRGDFEKETGGGGLGVAGLNGPRPLSVGVAF